MTLDDIKNARRIDRLTDEQINYLIQRVDELEGKLAWSAPISDAYDPDGRMYKELHLNTAKQCAEIADHQSCCYEKAGDCIRKEFGLEET